jgi:hypothetical protein
MKSYECIVSGSSISTTNPARPYIAAVPIASEADLCTDTSNHTLFNLPLGGMGRNAITESVSAATVVPINCRLIICELTL